MANFATRNHFPKSIFLFLLGLSLGSVCAILLVAAASGIVRADPAGPSPAAATRSTLLLRGEQPGVFRVAPDLATDVRMTVNGVVARTHVTQYFRNPFDEWQEGVYVFPLPEKAAVDSIHLRIGDRTIDGVIQERRQAKRTYARARDAGRRAALLEQERPNIFTSSVANIGPGEMVVVDIEYQQELRIDQGAFHLRFPLVVGPRYVPAGPGSGALVAGTGSPIPRVPDAARVTPPVRHPDEGLANPVQIRIDLHPGFDVAGIDSPYHPITVTDGDGGGHVVELAEKAVPADRDFELVWRPAERAVPTAAAFAEKVDDWTYALLMVTPPTGAVYEGAVTSREAIFVIDISGSMAGTSIIQAKRALDLALGRLHPDDTFNVLSFNNRTRSLFASARRATPEAVRTARSFVGNLAANGGTEMLGALDAALGSSSDGGRLRQVIFLTDGAVANEAELLNVVDSRIGPSRLFMVGIGSAPNGHLMQKASELGRGTFTYIGKADEVAEKMGALFTKLERPAVTNLNLALSDGDDFEMYPRRLPDAYAGEPVVVALRKKHLTGSATVTGLVGTRPWRNVVSLDSLPAAAGVGKIWARYKIEALEGSVRDGVDPAVARAAIIDVAIRHKLVSRYTSLVAVDTTPARPDSEPINRRDIASNLPHGWHYDKVFGESARPAAPTKFSTGASPAVLSLPQTATDADLRIGLGTMLLLLSAAGLALARRWI